MAKRSTHRTIVWDLGRMAEQLHAVLLVVPQHGGMVQEALLCDSLSIPTELDITKAVVCNSNDANQKQIECREKPGEVCKQKNLLQVTL